VNVTRCKKKAHFSSLQGISKVERRENRESVRKGEKDRANKSPTKMIVMVAVMVAVMMMWWAC